MYLYMYICIYIYSFSVKRAFLVKLKLFLMNMLFFLYLEERLDNSPVRKAADLQLSPWTDNSIAASSGGPQVWWNDDEDFVYDCFVYVGSISEAFQNDVYLFLYFANIEFDNNLFIYHIFLCICIYICT